MIKLHDINYETLKAKWLFFCEVPIPLIHRRVFATAQVFMLYC